MKLFPTYQGNRPSGLGGDSEHTDRHTDRGTTSINNIDGDYSVQYYEWGLYFSKKQLMHKFKFCRSYISKHILLCEKCSNTWASSLSIGCVWCSLAFNFRRTHTYRINRQVYTLPESCKKIPLHLHGCQANIHVQLIVHYPDFACTRAWNKYWIMQV